jgi:membrane-associated protease RseP (regulator of RpoE activity)
MRHRTLLPTTALTLLLLGAALALPAYAGEGSPNGEPKHHVVVEVTGSGDGEGATHVFVTPEGERYEVGAPGFHWVGAGEGPDYAFVHRSEDGGGFLGVGLTPLTPELRIHFGVPEDAGVLVSKVVEESPALAAGVEVGDILTGVDGETVGSAMALTHAVRSRDAGETVTLQVWRDGQPLELSATLDEAEGHDRIEKVRKVMIRCEEGDEDCAAHAGAFHGELFDCGGAEDCRVEVRCTDGDCSCVVNGETMDCARLHHGH